MASDDIDLEDLISEGLSYEEIIEEYEDAGYDSEDIAEAFADLDYDYDEALYDTIAEQNVDLDYFEAHVHDWADFLDTSVHDLYELYYGYED
jgi:hypothetical protein